MKKTILSAQDDRWYHDLVQHTLLSTGADGPVDAITKLAATQCEVKMAFVTVVDREHVAIKSRIGAVEDEVARMLTLCDRTSQSRGVLVLNDISSVMKLSDFAASVPVARHFYAGVALRTQSGAFVGVLGVLHSSPKEFSPAQMSLLESLGNMVVALWEKDLRKATHTASTVAAHLTGLSEEELLEEKLLFRDQSYRTRIDQSSDAIMTLSPPDWHFCTANPATLKLFGCSSVEEFCQLAPWKLSPEFQPDGKPSADLAPEMIKLALSQGAHFFEWTHIRLDGTAMPCTVLLSRIIERDKHYLQATVRDISEQKMYERELQLSKRHLEVALESANLGIWELNLSTGEVQYDERWFRALDLYPENWPTTWETWACNIHAEDLPRVNQELEDFKAGNAMTFETVYRMRHHAGTWLYILFRAKYSEWDVNGTPFKLTGTILDITVQKRRELVQEEISRLRGDFISLSNDRKSFFKHLIGRLIHLANGNHGLLGEVEVEDKERILRVFAFSSLNTTDTFDRMSGEFGIQDLVFRKRHKLMTYVLEAGEPLAINDQALLKNLIPSQLPELENFLALPIHHNGQVIAVAGIANREQGFDDSLISDLRPFMEVIGEMIHARRAEDELAHQKQLAMHASKLASIGQLAAGVGHEINNPLAIISGQLALAQIDLASNPYPEVADRLCKMEIAAGRIANIVKGLRTFARSDIDKLSSFDFYTSIEETVAMLEGIFAREQVVLRLTGARIPTAILGNRGHLQQVLVNLISNAKDATEGKSSREILVAVNYGDDRMKVSVTDNGSGIPQEIREKILEPFFTTKDVNKGTGIGLSLVSTILKEHKGRLEISTAIGEGSTFSFDLPVTTVTEAQLSGRSMLKQVPKERFEIRVLLVDDEEGLREVLQHMLSDICTEVVAAPNAQEGLRLLREGMFDVVISDIQMPEIDGFKFLELLRREALPVQPRFIFITGGVEMSPTQEGIADREADGFLPKPFDPGMIAAKLRELRLKKPA